MCWVPFGGRDRICGVCTTVIAIVLLVVLEPWFWSRGSDTFLGGCVIDATTAAGACRSNIVAAPSTVAQL